MCEQKIGLDLSLNSSAMTIKNKNGIKLFNYTATKEGYKWFKDVKDYITFRFIEYENFDDYSENEIYKIKKYNEITDLIINDMLDNIDLNEKIQVNIEGYSFSSNAGNSILDIVSYSTMLRLKIYEKISKNINIFSPKTVKVQTCLKIYGYLPPPIGKKGQVLKDPKITCNKDGVKGGDWDKQEMYKAIIDGNIQNPLYNYLLENKEVLLEMKKIPKPFDDIIDSIHIMNL
jgi:hypothetical protein